MQDLFDLFLPLCGGNKILAMTCARICRVMFPNVTVYDEEFCEKVKRIAKLTIKAVRNDGSD